MTTAEQQRRGRTATHADVATAGKRCSHLPATADGYGHAAAATADANPATSATATATANGKFWRCVHAGQPDGNVWNEWVMYILLSTGTSWAPTFDS